MSTDQRQQELTHTLEELGISSKEVEVLYELLRVGRASAAELAKTLPSISRTSVYDQLRTLEQKSLVSTIVEEKGVVYQPEQLGYVIDTLEQDKRAIEQKQNALRSVTDFYEQMRNGTTYRPGVRTFKGRQGIRAVHRELQDARTELRAIGDLAAVAKIFPSIRTEDNLKDFQTNKIPRWSLMAHNKEAEQYLKIAPPGDLHHVRWLPKDTVISTDTLLWEGHVAIIDYTEPGSAVVIDNPTIYQTFLNWFAMMWQVSEEVRR